MKISKKHFIKPKGRIKTKYQGRFPKPKLPDRRAEGKLIVGGQDGTYRYIENLKVYHNKANGQKIVFLPKLVSRKFPKFINVFWEKKSKK
jgi:hypothetical protein